MNWYKVGVIYRKEIRDTLRDRRTLIMMIMVPILLYPLLFTTMGQLMTTGHKRLEEQKSIIALHDSLPQALVDSILENDRFEIKFPGDPADALKQRGIQGYVTREYSSDTLRYVVFYDGAIDRSRICMDRLTDALNDYRRQLQETLLTQRLVDISVLSPFEITRENIAPPSRMGGMLLGSIIPMLLIVTMVLGAMYPAIDLTAGEKERGTLETILTVPVDRMELLFGKFFTVTTTAFITGLLNLASMMAVYTSGMVQMGEATGRLEFGITPVGLILLIFSLIPFALFVSAAIISVCLFARSFKEAQNFVTPIYLLIMFPTFIALMPGVEFNRTLALIPVVNISLLFREIFLSNYPLELITMTFVANIMVAMLFIVIVVKLFNAENVLFGESQGFQFSLRRSTIKPADVLPVSTALFVFAGIMLLIFYIGAWVQMKSVQTGLMITEWLLILLPVITVLWIFKIDFRKTLQLRNTHWLTLPGTFLAGAGAFGLVLWISRLQMEIFPEYEALTKSFEKIMNMSTTSINPVWGLVIFALSPAICEEMLFRGMLLSSFKKTLPAWVAVVLTGLLFGMFHIHIYRMLPTGLLGILFAYIVYRSDSIYPGILAHFVNNAVIFLLLNMPGLTDKIPWLTGDSWPTWQVTLIMVLLLLSGILMIESGNRIRLKAGRSQAVI